MSPDQVAPEAAPVAQILAEISAAVGAVGKDSTAPSQIGGYRFRGVDAVVNAVSPHLARARVLMVPQVLDIHREVVQSGGGRAMKVVTVTTRFRFYGPAGDHLDVTVLGEASDAGDKATSKAQSVALRVALLQALMLPTDEPDPDESNFQREQPQAQQHRQQDPHPAVRPQAPQGEPRREATADDQARLDAAQVLANRARARRTQGTLRKVYEEARDAGLLQLSVRTHDEQQATLYDVIAARRTELPADDPPDDDPSAEDVQAGVTPDV